MANIIIKNDERNSKNNRILEQFKADKSDPAMREAADIIRAKQDELIEKVLRKGR